MASSNSASHVQTVQNNGAAGKDLSLYRPLHKAVLSGDWGTAKRIFEQEPDAVRTPIIGNSITTLMIAVKSPHRNHFVKNLLELLSTEDVAKATDNGLTALHFAAAAGNIEAAELLVSKNPHLPNIPSIGDALPLEQAIICCKREMILYLLNVTKEDVEPKPYEGQSGAFIVGALIFNGLFDIAMLLVRRYPELALTHTRPLSCISRINTAFRSGTNLNLWQRLIYSYVPTKLDDSEYHCSGRDIENPPNSFSSVKRSLHNMFWKATEMLVPHIKHIRDIKWKHDQAIQLVKQVCGEVAKLDFIEAYNIFGPAMLIAATFGISEVVEEILTIFPEAIYIRNEMDQNVFHVAIANRRKNVFNLIYQFHDEFIGQINLSLVDLAGNSGLDLVSCLKSEQELNLKVDAAGAALQMQRELQWFKEVEKYSSTYKNRWRVGENTPAMVFTETHKNLVKEGEKWIKNTANSCTIVAALVLTIVFAAAITVPGGNDDKGGLPIFSKEKAFIIFIISDALALYSSTSSVLMFLSILTSRYAEVDFLYTLPKKLIDGLVTLLISIISMMIAFGATLYLDFGHKKALILIPVTAFSCIPVTLFMSSQFPLLLDMIESTYGHSIFGQKSDRILY